MGAALTDCIQQGLQEGVLQRAAALFWAKLWRPAWGPPPAETDLRLKKRGGMPISSRSLSLPDYYCRSGQPSCIGLKVRTETRVISLGLLEDLKSWELMTGMRNSENSNAVTEFESSGDVLACMAWGRVLLHDRCTTTGNNEGGALMTTRRKPKRGEWWRMPAGVS